MRLPQINIIRQKSSQIRLSAFKNKITVKVFRPFIPSIRVIREPKQTRKSASSNLNYSGIELMPANKRSVEFIENASCPPAAVFREDKQCAYEVFCVWIQIVYEILAWRVACFFVLEKLTERKGFAVRRDAPDVVFEWNPRLC